MQTSGMGNAGYQVPMRTTAWVGGFMPSWGMDLHDVIHPGMGVRDVVRMRHAKGRVTTQSKPPPTAMLGPFCAV